MSGRIEETNRPTVVAVANGISRTILISAREKRLLLNELKRKRPGRGAKLHHVLVFSTLVFYLIREYVGEFQQITIDLEYKGHEASIKEHVLNLCYRYGLKARCEIVFSPVGKKSPAHEKAIMVYRGKVKADQVITAREILRELG